MNRETMVKFRGLVSDAREACAGSDQLSLGELLDKVHYARRFASRHKELEDYEGILNIVFLKLRYATEHEDRLEPDNILCDIINEIDRSEGI